MCKSGNLAPCFVMRAREIFLCPTQGGGQSAAEAYAASLANELDKTQRDLGSVASELETIKRSKPYRALNLMRRMMRRSRG